MRDFSGIWVENRFREKTFEIMEDFIASTRIISSKFYFVFLLLFCYFLPKRNARS